MEWIYKSMKQMGIMVGAVKNGSNGGCSGRYDKIGVKNNLHRTGGTRTPSGYGK